MPRRGLSARRTPMLPTTCVRPEMPRKRNHSVITGPKNLPMVEVPACCMANSTHKMAMVMATTMFWLSPMKA